jgi:ABC-2 type transport system permease protein
MIWVIARREFIAMFQAPLAWIILAVIQTILGYLFLTNLDNFFLMQVAAIILLMVMPLLTMRSIAEEKRNRSLTLLISAPLSMTEIVLGKFFGLMLFVLVLISMLMLMPLSLYLGTSPDIGKLLSIYLGMLLLLGSFSAIGLYLSSLTENQTIAAVGSFGILLMLWIVDWLSASVDSGQSILAYLSLLQHHQSMLEGVFDSSDIAYYLLLITGFLGLTIRQLDRERLL